MTDTKNFEPGNLVEVRNRQWVVQPNDDKDLIVLKPLGGSDLETCAIFKPLAFAEDKIKEISFPYPNVNDVGAFDTAKILYNASRLSFRNGAGPFRSFGKLSFRPHAFQLVPLIMALKQKTIRMLIADDVGVGKTIEAGMILRELIDRGELKRFAIICPPHLCEQWQQELFDKFSLDAVIVRSGNISQLERNLLMHQSIYTHYPYLVVSIDYVKSDAHRNLFIQESPDMIVVDEAHTCTNAPGQERSAQQQRYRLVRDLIKNKELKKDKHLLLLTATPHSGLQTQFQSLIGLMNEEFGKDDFDITQKAALQKLAPHMVMRKRIDIKQFLHETINFPDRNADELPYKLSQDYDVIFNKVLDFARETVKQQDGKNFKQRIRFWAALSLLRGVMSSPAAGVEMLRKRSLGLDENTTTEINFTEQGVADADDQNKERLSIDLRDNANFSQSEERKLYELALQLEKTGTMQKDNKVAVAIEQVSKWLKKGLQPIIFCRYIETAKYVGKLMQENLQAQFKNLNIEVITGELHDEIRREKIDAMSDSPLRLVIATDCLSEGINLQSYFNALMHYDLPWNPNRLEQREGRIDRLGQQAKEVEIRMLYGKDNPMDGVVLEVLLRRAEQIRRSVGISVPFNEDSTSIMEAVGAAVLFRNKNANADAQQLSLGFDTDDSEYKKAILKVEQEYERQEKKMKQIREIFSQQQLTEKLDIEQNLKVSDDALGNMTTVKEFIMAAVQMADGQIIAAKDGYRINAGNMPHYLLESVVKKNEIKISFDSPTPSGYQYIGRNHPFTEQLCRYALANAMQLKKDGKVKVARTTIFRTNAVETKTVILLLRIRNILNNESNNQILAEEMDVFGYQNNIDDKQQLNKEQCMELLQNASTNEDLSAAQQQVFLANEIEAIKQNTALLNEVVLEHNQRLLNEHERYQPVLQNQHLKIGTLVPPDIMGIYILFPVIKIN